MRAFLLSLVFFNIIFEIHCNKLQEFIIIYYFTWCTWFLSNKFEILSRHTRNDFFTRFMLDFLFSQIIFLISAGFLVFSDGILVFFNILFEMHCKKSQQCINIYYFTWCTWFLSCSLKYFSGDTRNDLFTWFMLAFLLSLVSFNIIFEIHCKKSQKFINLYNFTRCTRYLRYICKILNNEFI